jgi:hypothetical protein
MSVRKFILVLAAIAAVGLGFVSVPEAKADVDIYVGAPFGFWPGWSPGRWITCGQGARLVDDRGFSKVRAVDCSRPTFRYKARRHGDWWIVKVDARYARIVSARPM